MDSEPAKHIRANPEHSFTWRLLLTVPTNNRLYKFLEASIIATKRPKLNEQIESHKKHFYNLIDVRVCKYFGLVYIKTLSYSL